MSSQATVAERRNRAKKFISIVDKAALGVMFTFSVAVLPLYAVGFLTRIV